MQRFIQPGTIEFKPNKTTHLELEVGSVNTALYLLFDYFLAGAPADRIPFAGILGLIRELKITINNTDDVLRLSGNELMAIYIADNGRRPSTTPVVELGEDVRNVFPINHWCTNTEVIALTAHDYRKANKVVLSITWGDVGDLFHEANDGNFTSFRCAVEQQAVQRYVSPLDGKVNKAGKPRRYNPAVRYFYRTEETFDRHMTGVELGRIEATDNAARCKGFIMFATREEEIYANAFSGDLTLVQGDVTLGKVSLDVLRSSMETMKATEISNDVIYFPFSGLGRGVEIEDTRRWDDDIIIYGDITTGGNVQAPTTVTVLSDSYRQEKLK